MGRASVVIFAVAIMGSIALQGCDSHNGRLHPADAYEPGFSYGAYDYRGSDYGSGPTAGNGGYLSGEGAALLDPWLALTPEGREIISRAFGLIGGQVSVDTAHRANIWFRRYADTNRDLALTDPEIRTALVTAAIAPGN